MLGKGNSERPRVLPGQVLAASNPVMLLVAFLAVIAVLTGVLFLAVDAASYQLARATGVVAVVDGHRIYAADLGKAKDSSGATVTPSAEEVLNAARNLVFTDYLDAKGVAQVSDAEYEKALPSYIGTSTVAAAAAQAGLTEAGLKKEISFEIRMNDYYAAYTGLGKAPTAPASQDDTAAVAAYEKAMELYTPKATAANEKWQALLASLFRSKAVKLYTLTISAE